MTIGKRIKQKRRELGLTQEDVAKKVKTTKQAIYKYENGIVTNIPLDKIEILAEALHTTSAYLMGWEKDNFALPANILPLPKTKKVPRLGTIACGEPILAEAHIAGYDELPENVHADFSLVCQGDSMINARILDGDIVFIRTQPDVDDGEIAAVCIDDEATLKRVRKTKDSVILLPENPAFVPLVYNEKSFENVRILGKAVWFQSVVR